MTVFTIGHSDRPIDVFVRLLRANGVTRLVDIRKMPASRHNPQFEQTRLHDALDAAGITYRHEPRLGGLRRSAKDSPNTGWKNTSFRAYADYMATPDFAQALATLIEEARHDVTAVMCAEAVWWRCHRMLVADALTEAGVQVRHVMSDAPPSPHRPTPFLRVRDGVLTYPPPG